MQEALKTNNPYSPEGLEIAQMHAKWLAFTGRKIITVWKNMWDLPKCT